MSSDSGNDADDEETSSLEEPDDHIDVDIDDDPANIEPSAESKKEEDLSQPDPVGYPPSIIADQTVTDIDLSSYMCHRCHHLLKNPCQSKCGHRFCEECFNDADGKPCPGCLYDDEEDPGVLRRGECLPDNASRREIGKLFVKCITPRCEFTGLFRDYLQHFRACPMPRGPLHSSDDERRTTLSNRSCVSYHQRSSPEDDPRFPTAGTSPGRLIWEISNVGINHHQAQQRTPSYMDSLPFFSRAEGGYKLYARVYLAGDGVGRGQHMSLYVGVMRGQHDDQLAWPPAFKIRITLLNLENDAHNITMDIKRPDPSSSSFQKPVHDKNTPTGSPSFCPMGQITSGAYGFVRGNVFYIQVEVHDPAELPRATLLLAR